MSGDPIFVFNGVEWVPIGGGGGYAGPWMANTSYGAGSLVYSSGSLWGAPDDITGSIYKPGTDGPPPTPLAIGSDNIESAPLIPDALALPNVPLLSPAFSNASYTVQAGETFTRASKTAWWKYQPTKSGDIWIDTSLPGAAGDTYLTLFSSPTPTFGGFNTLTVLQANDDFSGVRSGLTAPVTSGTTYYICASSYVPDEPIYLGLRFVFGATDPPPTVSGFGPWHWVGRKPISGGRWLKSQPSNTNTVAAPGRFHFYSSPNPAYGVAISTMDADGNDHSHAFNKQYQGLKIGDTLFMRNGATYSTGYAQRGIITAYKSTTEEIRVELHPLARWTGATGDPFYIQWSLTSDLPFPAFQQVTVLHSLSELTSLPTQPESGKLWIIDPGSTGWNIAAATTTHIAMSQFDMLGRQMGALIASARTNDTFVITVNQILSLSDPMRVAAKITGAYSLPQIGSSYNVYIFPVTVTEVRAWSYLYQQPDAIETMALLLDRVH